MENTKNDSLPSLVFVYNADSGLFNALTDMAHKAFSPQTYECNLCKLTFSTFGMRKSWKGFLSTLKVPLEFLHADELKSSYQISDVQLPAVFKKQGERLEVFLGAHEINECRTIGELMKLIRSKLN
ncbi:MAG: hypothetical protein ACR2G5_18390 [Pyrinomonadaceae bacterium]